MDISFVNQNPEYECFFSAFRFFYNNVYEIGTIILAIATLIIINIKDIIFRITVWKHLRR